MQGGMCVSGSTPAHTQVRALTDSARARLTAASTSAGDREARGLHGLKAALERSMLHLRFLRDRDALGHAVRAVTSLEVLTRCLDLGCTSEAQDVILGHLDATAEEAHVIMPYDVTRNANANRKDHVTAEATTTWTGGLLWLCAQQGSRSAGGGVANSRWWKDHAQALFPKAGVAGATVAMDVEDEGTAEGTDESVTDGKMAVNSDLSDCEKAHDWAASPDTPLKSVAVTLFKTTTTPAETDPSDLSARVALVCAVATRGAVALTELIIASESGWQAMSPTTGQELDPVWVAVLACLLRATERGEFTSDWLLSRANGTQDDDHSHDHGQSSPVILHAIGFLDCVQLDAHTGAVAFQWPATGTTTAVGPASRVEDDLHGTTLHDALFHARDRLCRVAAASAGVAAAVGSVIMPAVMGTFIASANDNDDLDVQPSHPRLGAGATLLTQATFHCYERHPRAVLVKVCEWTLAQDPDRWEVWFEAKVARRPRASTDLVPSVHVPRELHGQGLARPQFAPDVSGSVSTRC